MDALERGGQLLLVKARELPIGALRLRNALSQKVGMCVEVCLTAFAWYAQIVEELPCSDPAYAVPPGERDWVQSVVG